MRLRPATIDDRALLRRWAEQPHVTAAGGGDWIGDEDLRRARAGRTPCIAEQAGRPVGFVQIVDPAREESRYWGDAPAGLRALDLWIGEEADLGRGLGTEMLRLALERCFADPSVTAVLVDPLAGNVRAHRFYERSGFRAVERRRFGQDECLVHRLERADFAPGGAAARRGLALAAAAAGVATAGDLLMLWVANAARPALGLPAPPAGALAIGGALGVLAIPLYALGYRAVARGLAPAAPRAARLVRACGIGAAGLGAAIHALTARAIAAGGGAADASPAAAVAADGLLLAAWAAAAALVLLAAGALVAGGWRVRALRRLVWGNPVVLTLAIALAGLPTETGRSFVLPAAPNLAHVAFFLAAQAALGRRREGAGSAR